MEHYFRITLCMFLFVGYLQANPVNICSFKSIASINPNNLMLEFLDKDACGRENFTSPSNVKDECAIAALRTFSNELERVLNSKKCQDDESHINATLNALNKFWKTCTPPTSSPDCKWGPSKQFEHFQEDLISLIQKSWSSN